MKLAVTGKGGVGKSLTSLNLSTYLSMMGRQVVVIDGDLTSGGSMIRNVSTVFKDGIGYDAVGLLDSVKGQVGLR